MRSLKFLILIFTCLVFSNIFAEPTLNGLFYGDGDNNEYYLLAEAVGARGTIYYYYSDTYLYIAVVVDTSVNDNVFGKHKTNDKLYVQSVGWSNKHEASSLIGSDHLAFKLTNNTTIWTWSQDLLYDSNDNSSPYENDWLSDSQGGEGTGIPPIGIESSSSTAWNLNNANDINNSNPWDVTLGGTRDPNAPKEWKSPHEELDHNSAPGYPTYDTIYGWEWPLVYEMKIPLLSIGTGQITIEVLSAHNSPAKDNVPDVPIPPVDLLDLGDAPDSYHTLKANNGAAHWILPNGPHLGLIVDADVDGEPTADCTGDDISDGTDDEDGVTFSNYWVPNQTANVVVNASTSGFLSAWVDFNNDGDWDDAGENIFSDEALLTGDNNLQVTIPAGAMVGYINTRFRFSTDTGLASSGTASDGEVEDYRVEIINLCSLGDRVWYDADEDGIQDVDEFGLPGVTVYLWDGFNTNIGSDVTDDNGNYLFDNLLPGTYYVQFIPPAESGISLNDVGADDGIDSDAYPYPGANYGYTGTYTLAAGDNNLTVDCGIYFGDPLPVTLSSFSADFYYGNPRLQWVTQSESNNAFWNIYRAASANVGQAVKINYEVLIGAGTTSEPTEYIFIDHSLDDYIQSHNMINPTIYFWIESVSNDGNSELHGPISLQINNFDEEYSTPEIPDKYGLYPNYPNPFNPDTAIIFNLKKDEKASLVIYNIKGELVKTIFQDRECIQNRTYIETWRGKDNRGNTVSSGIYLAILKTDSKLFTRKMILQK